MDDEISSRIRDVVLAAVGRQRPQPDSDAAKQQMLLTTLRLAGHTVNLLPHEPVGPGDSDQPFENNPADGTAGPEESSADQTPDTGNPLLHDGLDRFDDPTRPADYGKLQLLPDIVTGPTAPAGGGLPHSRPITVLLPDRIAPGAATNDSLSDLVPEDETGSSSSGFEFTPADSDGFSPLLDDPTAADIPLVSDPPPALSITPDGDSPDPDPSPAPGIKLFIPSPGAGSLSFPPSVGGNGGDDGGDSQPLDSEGGSDDGQTSGGDPAIIVQPTTRLTERLATAAAEKALSLAQATVETAVSDLRHEIYVSRAAWNALFPR